MTIGKYEKIGVWARFIELAAMSDIERQAFYFSAMEPFLSALFETSMTNVAPPVIETAEDFSIFIVEARENYRLWNQGLMGLMLSLENSGQSSIGAELEEFSKNCPWKELAEAAENFTASKFDS